MNNEIVEPLKEYLTRFKDEYKEVIENTYNETLKKCNIDVSDVKNKFQKLNEQTSNYSKGNNAYNTYKTTKLTLWILFPIMLCLAFFFGFFSFDSEFSDVKFDSNINIIISVISFLLSILFLTLNLTFIKNKLLKIKVAILKYHEEMMETKEELEADLIFFQEELRELTPKIGYTRIHNVTKIIDIDDVPDLEKLLYLVKKCGLAEEFPVNESCLFIKTGSILGNPFCLFRTRVCKMVKKKFTGSTVVTYTIGRNTHSTTVTASLDVDVPEYDDANFLVFASDAAPNLCFNRVKTDITYPKNEKTLKSYQKKISANYKQIVRTYDSNIRKGVSSFTPLSDEEFEVMYNALNRNNDVEFRVLFTALARKNYLDSLKLDPIGYADDFIYDKDGMLNFIASLHSKQFDYSGETVDYETLDINLLKMNFINYHINLFEHFYYDFLPILNIPLFQHHKSIDYIYGKMHEYKFSSFEYETVANKFLPKYILHPQSATPGILKITNLKKDNAEEHINVLAKSHSVEMETTLVPAKSPVGIVKVPVHWPKYTELTHESVYHVLANSFTLDASSADLMIKYKQEKIKLDI